MDGDKDDKSILEKFTDTVKDMATSVTDAAKSAMEPETGKTEDTPRMTADEIAKEAAEDPETVAEKTNEQMYISDAAAMPMPLVAPKKRKAPVRLTPAKIPPKKAAAKKSSKKAAKKKQLRKPNHQPDGRLSERTRPLRRLRRKRRRNAKHAR